MTGSKSEMLLDFSPDDLHPILLRFVEKGFSVWLVGGALRDHLWGWMPKDWDLVTDASPHQVMALFPRVIPIGVRHGTVQIHSDQRTIEATSCPASGPEGILTDLGRRDFTINALALSYPEGRLIDPFGGQKDLLSLTLRTVGEAPARFHEDPLRTLRAGRFISVYGFRLEPPTFTALENAAAGLQRVAWERIREELFKMLLGEYFTDAFESMMRGRVIEQFLPELVEANRTNGLRRVAEKPLEHSVLTVQCAPSRLRVRLAALLHNISETRGPQPVQEVLSDQTRFRQSASIAGKIMRRLRTSRTQAQEVVFLVENQILDLSELWTDADVRRFLARVGTVFLDDILDLAYADRLAREDRSETLKAFQVLQFRITQELRRRPPLRIQDLALNGQDTMELLRLEPGPAVGELLRRLHEVVLEDPTLNRRKFLMNFVRKEYNK